MGWLALQRAPVVVRDRHQGDVVGVAVERQQHRPAGQAQHVGARHPAEAVVEPVREAPDEPRQFVAVASRGRAWRAPRVRTARASASRSSGRSSTTPPSFHAGAPRPSRRRAPSGTAAAPTPSCCRRWPARAPRGARARRRTRWDCSRETPACRRPGTAHSTQPAPVPPRRAPFEPHVVRAPLAAAAVPDREQVAVRQFDDRGRVDVLRLRRQDEPRLETRGLRGTCRTEHQSEDGDAKGVAAHPFSIITMPPAATRNSWRTGGSWDITRPRDHHHEFRGSRHPPQGDVCAASRQGHAPDVRNRRLLRPPPARFRVGSQPRDRKPPSPRPRRTAPLDVGRPHGRASATRG